MVRTESGGGCFMHGWRQIGHQGSTAVRRATGGLIVLPLVLFGVLTYALAWAAYLLLISKEKAWVAHPSWVTALIQLLIALGAPLILGYYWKRSRMARRVLRVADWFGAGLVAYSVVWTGWSLHEFLDPQRLTMVGRVLLPYSWVAWGIIGTWLFIVGTVDLSRELSTEWRERQRLEALMEFTGRITSLDYQTILNEAVKHLYLLLEADACVLYLWNSDEQVLVPVAGQHAPSVYPPAYVQRMMSFRCPMGFGITGWVMQSGIPYISGDVMSDVRSQAVPGWGRDEKSSLLAPIQVEGRRLGVVRLTRHGLNQFHQDDLDLVMSFAGQAALVIEHGRIVKELSELSITDNLTGLYNARHFQHVVNVEITRSDRGRQPLALLMIDSDSLKQINDVRGHLRGDEHIRRIGRVLKEHIRLSDYAFRYAGDEFLLMLPNTGQDEALMVAERIRRLIEENEAEDAMHVTVSIGVGIYPTHAVDAESLLSVADRAMYASKRSGKNRVTTAEVVLSPAGTPPEGGVPNGEQYMA